VHSPTVRPSMFADPRACLPFVRAITGGSGPRRINAQSFSQQPAQPPRHPKSGGGAHSLQSRPAVGEEVQGPLAGSQGPALSPGHDARKNGCRGAAHGPPIGAMATVQVHVGGAAVPKGRHGQGAHNGQGVGGHGPHPSPNRALCLPGQAWQHLPHAGHQGCLGSLPRTRPGAVRMVLTAVHGDVW
jgi:hypothetical protein